MEIEDKRPIPIQLECGHKAYFKKPLPRDGEILYCRQCEKYVDVGVPDDAYLGRSYYPEYDMEVEPIGTGSRKWRGYCTYGLGTDERCKHTVDGGNFYKLRDSLHSHYMRTHTRFAVNQLQLEFTTEDAPGRKEAPF